MALEVTERPKIEDTLIGFSLKQAHDEYLRSPPLYVHIQILDKYIDSLEKAVQIFEKAYIAQRELKEEEAEFIDEIRLRIN